MGKIVSTINFGTKFSFSTKKSILLFLRYRVFDNFQSLGPRVSEKQSADFGIPSFVNHIKCEYKPTETDR